MSATSYRSHTCDQLRLEHVDQEVTLVGWVAARRDHGKLIFIDLRDRDGLTQVVFFLGGESSVLKQAEELRQEFVIAVHGTVQARPKGMINPELPTGEVEVGAGSLTILNMSRVPAFEVQDDIDASEEVRLQFRHVDLRRPEMLKRLRLRHRVSMEIRQYLDGEDFVEVETPILTRSTPEGARDFLVPSRQRAGQFYALPQSPQLFKQLLMVAGVERYFQLARCFRDEDLRADRQPEFTQLDVEMSFINEDELFALMEALMARVFKQALDVDLEVPFPRITYREAMDQHGSDKPDLRRDGEAFRGIWVIDYPLLDWNADTARWQPTHHPFTAPREEDLDRLESDPGSVLSRAYDLVMNGVELGSGSIRIHQRSLQERVFAQLQIGAEEAQAKFGFLLEALEDGAPPHGGIALGLDRLVAMMAGVDSVREVIAFPKTSRGACPLTGAPAVVDASQLAELRVRVIGEQETAPSAV